MIMRTMITRTIPIVEKVIMALAFVNLMGKNNCFLSAMELALALLNIEILLPSPLRQNLDKNRMLTNNSTPLILKYFNNVNKEFLPESSSPKKFLPQKIPLKTFLPKNPS